MLTETIELRECRLVIEDGIAEFSHQRPEARNALSSTMRLDYREMLDRVEADRSIRALILTGSQGSFCAGGDVRVMQRMQEEGSVTSEAVRRRVLDFHAWFQRLRDLDIPVIAAVDGPAAGAGFSLALVADFVLASSRATFCMSFARVGLIPDLAALYQLPRIVGLSRAKELVLTARKLGAEEARQLGIVHAIHEPGELEKQAWAFARRFVSGPREAMGLGKCLLNRSFETPYQTMVELEAASQAIAAGTSDFRESIADFFAGRPARYDWDRG
ncbi:enoyl-CoA hydratase/isomerase family protein [Cupriavidus numazuensis]|uniref:4-chlorobenzoyl coenzyme A dehalogenase-2 n=1 Tax=Cupriavidus numazuensis TaxID=221992 RepID=A0ABN7QCP2_9BURK|nr:enoyl-CoA hydratase/isomerase family protein [Cupriavidus numazuensis]CAG2160464.1 4-chlorobenzoyl coenzyme A dehalogenase-2 [Cupriavidus numazuensis]